MSWEAEKDVVVYCNRGRGGAALKTRTPPVGIMSSYPSLLLTTLGTYLSRIMLDTLMMAF
jgi:hypothetical protein